MPQRKPSAARRAPASVQHHLFAMPLESERDRGMHDLLYRDFESSISRGTFEAILGCMNQIYLFVIAHTMRNAGRPVTWNGLSHPRRDLIGTLLESASIVSGLLPGFPWIQPELEALAAELEPVPALPPRWKTHTSCIASTLRDFLEDAVTGHGMCRHWILEGFRRCVLDMIRLVQLLSAERGLSPATDARIESVALTVCVFIFDEVADDRREAQAACARAMCAVHRRAAKPLCPAAAAKSLREMHACMRELAAAFAPDLSLSADMPELGAPAFATSDEGVLRAKPSLCDIWLQSMEHSIYADERAYRATGRAFLYELACDAAGTAALLLHCDQLRAQLEAARAHLALIHPWRITEPPCAPCG